MIWRKKMKIVKSIICLTICVGALSLTGCSTDKTAISADTFTEKMEETGLTVNDQSQEAPADSGMSDVRVAFGEENYQIEFYAFGNEEAAKSLYNTVQSNLEDIYESASNVSKTSKNVGNYGTYALSADDMYYSISRVGNTLIYAIGDDDYKGQVKDIVEDLGY